jgi:hypothetical protein
MAGNQWMFARVPFGFWDDRGNRKRYLGWLGRKLKFKRPKDWHRARRRDFVESYGGGLLARYDSYLGLVKECVPGFK